MTALLLPVAMVGFMALNSEQRGELSANAFAITGMLGFVVLFVVYHNLVTTYVARREELVLKRLRSGEARDPEIIVGAAVPAIVVALTQAVLAVAAGAVFLDLPVPVNAPVLVAGLLAGIAVFVLLAAGSTAFTRTVEVAQISTTPVIVVCSVGSGVITPLDAMPDQLADVLRFLPLTPVVDLVRLGWLGTTGPATPVGFGGVFAEAVAPLAILVGWTALGTYGFRRWFRWEPRR